MKKYNIKVNYMGYWMEHTNCYLISSIEEYNEYMLLLNNKFLVSESEIKNLKTFIGHGYSGLTGITTFGVNSGLDSKEGRELMLVRLKVLQAKVLTGQLTYILEGNRIVINDRGGYFPLRAGDKYEIVAIIENIKYTKKDISVKKWEGGRHYYAKVGNIDVIDEFGDAKWNTEQYAYDMAVKFMNKLNENN